MTEVLIPKGNSPGPMRQVRSPISEHSHKSCIYPNRFCHREQTQSAESMFGAMWSFIGFVWKKKSNFFDQIRCMFPAELTVPPATDKLLHLSEQEAGFLWEILWQHLRSITGWIALEKWPTLLKLGYMVNTSLFPVITSFWPKDSFSGNNARTLWL